MYNLIDFIKEAKLINGSVVWDRHEKDCRLAGIMTKMESMYNIPMFRDAEWEKHNRDVLKAYKFVSSLRST